MNTTKKKSQKTIEEIKGTIIKELKKRYQMDVKAFSESSLPEEWGITQTPASIRVLFTPNKISFPLYSKIWASLYETSLDFEKKINYFIIT
jgi:hypothetical protein